MKNFVTRSITAVVGVILLYFIIKNSGIYLSTAILFMSIVGIYEIKNCFKNINININAYLLYIFTVFLFLIRSVPKFEVMASFEYVFILIIMLISFVLDLDINRNMDDSVYTVFSYIYIPVIFDLLYKMNNIYLVLVFIMAFATDTFAYIVGITMGRHKLIPSISPKKSVEGAIGGVVGAVILGCTWLNYNDFKLDILTVIFLIFTSISSQLGDLIASKIKRVAGIKDYGNIFPGHGGVLDRFDSILDVTVIIFLFSKVMEVLWLL